MELFRKLGEDNVRIRGARPSDEESMKNRGTDAAPSYHVVGILTSRNQLILPGAVFKATDRGKLTTWIKRLREVGVDDFFAPRLAFGLTSKQLVSLHGRLEVPVEFETKDVRAGDVARRLIKHVGVPYEVTTAARAAFARDELVSDELRGISHGTALAAVLRPLGLVASPRKASGGKVEILITDVRDADEAWPIGWPIEDVPVNVAPKLFEYLNVAIQDTPLSDALAAIQPRIELPLLFDYNAMARHRIALDKKQVNFPRKRTFYHKILANLLSQAGLKNELRMDEAGKPFLWISTVRN